MKRMADAIRKLFRFRNKNRSNVNSKSNSKESNNSKKGKKLSNSSSVSSLSSSSHNSQSNKISSTSNHLGARTHQIVPANGVAQSTTSNKTSFNEPSTIRTRRLMKEYHELWKITQSYSNNSEGFPPFHVELVNDCLHEWNIKVYQFDTESQIYNDMKELGIECVLLNVTFPENYPFTPPFIRVVSPHIEKGFVMAGGAICMELLTRQGWASAYTMEAVIMQLTCSFVKGQATIKRTKPPSRKKFSKKLAEASFRNVIRIHDQHGWVSPPLSEGVVILDDVKRMHQVASTNLSDEKADFMLR